MNTYYPSTTYGYNSGGAYPYFYGASNQPSANSFGFTPYQQSPIESTPPQVYQNVELQILVEDTNSLYKVYFNQGYHPTLPDYYSYLSENLKVPNPSTFSLRRDDTKEKILSVGEFVNGLKLTLIRNKQPILPPPLPVPQPIVQPKVSQKKKKPLIPTFQIQKPAPPVTIGESATGDTYNFLKPPSQQKKGGRHPNPEKQQTPVKYEGEDQPRQNGLQEVLNSITQFKNSQGKTTQSGTQTNTGFKIPPLVTNLPADPRSKGIFKFNKANTQDLQIQSKQLQTLVSTTKLPELCIKNDLSEAQNQNEVEDEEQVDTDFLSYPESYFRENPFSIIRYPTRRKPVLPDQAETPYTSVKCEQEPGLSYEDQRLLDTSNDLRFQNPLLRDYLKQNNLRDLPLKLNQLLDEPRLDKELDRIQGGIKILLKALEGIKDSDMTMAECTEQVDLENDKDLDQLDCVKAESTLQEYELPSYKFGTPNDYDGKNQPYFADSNQSFKDALSVKESATTQNPLLSNIKMDPLSILEGVRPLKFDLQSALLSESLIKNKKTQGYKPYTAYSAHASDILNRRCFKDRDRLYCKSQTLPGFKPFEPWVPPPEPYKEVIVARDMYTRGEKLIVQTPDFVDFANELTTFSSRNTLISQCKKMCFQRGIRGNMRLGQSGEGREFYITVECARAGKAGQHVKNFTIKNGCPFMIQFQRKSVLTDPLQAHQMAKDCSLRFTESTHNLKTGTSLKSKPWENTLKEQKQPIEDEFDGGDEFEFKATNQGLANDGSSIDYGAESAPRYEDNPWGFGPWRDVSRYAIMEDVNIPGDPYYLARYRSFHNHEVDLNLMAHVNLMNEKDIWRKGAWRTMPQGIVAIQGLIAKRKAEIIEKQLKQSSKVLTFEDCKKRFDRLKNNISNSYNSQQSDTSSQCSFKGEDEDDFYGIEIEQVEKSTTLIRMDLLERYETRVIEPLGMDPFLIICETNLSDNLSNVIKEDVECSTSSWAPSSYQLDHSYPLILKFFTKLTSQVHKRLCRGIYTIDEYRKTFRCFNRQQKPPQVKPEPSRKKKVQNPEEAKNKKLQALVSNFERQMHNQDELVNSDEESYMRRAPYDMMDEEQTNENYNDNYSVYD